MSAELTLPSWVTGFPSRTYLPGSAVDRLMAKLSKNGSKRLNVTPGTDPDVTSDQIAEQVLKVFGEIESLTPEQLAERQNFRLDQDMPQMTIEQIIARATGSPGAGA